MLHPLYPLFLNFQNSPVSVQTRFYLQTAAGLGQIQRTFFTVFGLLPFYFFLSPDNIETDILEAVTAIYTIIDEWR